MMSFDTTTTVTHSDATSVVTATGFAESHSEAFFRRVLGDLVEGVPLFVAIGLLLTLGSLKA